MHMCSCDMGVEESNLNPSNMMHASTHVRFGNALGMENLVCNRFEGQSAEFLLAMAELCSLIGRVEHQPYMKQDMKHDMKHET